MINHLRTLILNQAGPGGTRFDQLVPDNFQPISLSAEESRVRGLLLNPISPRDFQEFVATAAARIVYGTELGAKFIDPIDPRSTIDWRSNQSTSLSPRVVLRRLLGSSLVDVFGTFSPDFDRGIFSNSWTLTAISSSSVTIEDSRLGTSRVEPLTFSSGASQAIQLEPRSKLYYRFTNTPSVFPVVSVVEADEPPRLDPLKVLQRLHQEERVGAFINSLGEPALITAYQDRTNPMNSVAAALCAYCLSISRRIGA